MNRHLHLHLHTCVSMQVSKQRHKLSRESFIILLTIMTLTMVTSQKMDKKSSSFLWQSHTLVVSSTEKKEGSSHVPWYSSQEVRTSFSRAQWRGRSTDQTPFVSSWFQELTHTHTRPCGPEVLFKTCVAMKFVDDNDTHINMVTLSGI